MIEGLKEIVARLERCVDKLEDPAIDPSPGQLADGFVTIIDAQRIVEALDQPPNQITLFRGPAPLPNANGGYEACCAEASWGSGDKRQRAYGLTWPDVLIALAMTLKLKEGGADGSD